MASGSPAAISFIGFGEAGQTCTHGLIASNRVRISANDLHRTMDAQLRVLAAPIDLEV